MKKALLIGGAGFIGKNIAEYLAKNRDYQITIADNFFRGKMDEDLRVLVKKYNIRIVEEDLTNPEVFKNFETDYDYVYMLASVVGVDYTTSIPNEVIRINTALIFNTLEWLRKTKCRKVLFTSSCECYAGTIEAFGYKIPTPESIPLCIKDISHPRFTYAVTKILGESGFLNYSGVFDFDCTIIRYHNVFGSRMGFKHVIPHLVQRFLNEEDPFKMYGYDQTRAFCFVTNAVEGTVLAMEKDVSNGEIYHIGATEEITIEQLIKCTGNLMGFKGGYVKAPTYPGSVSRRCPDISKARRELGYEPKVHWKDGLERTVEWYVDYIKSGKELQESFYDNKAKQS